MNRTIKEYLTNNFAELNLSSLRGKYNIRFELGGKIENGTTERINQVVNRASEIYNQAIGNNEIIISIEEYETDFYDLENKNQPYLSELITFENLDRFKGPFEQTYYETDKSGNSIEHIFEDKIDCDLLIGKITLDKETVSKIIRGKANLEMGFEPAIPQNIYFYSISKRIGFRIYDDRGCDIWSDNKENLKPIYESLNRWILDYDRPEIDSYFK
jgi:hypothetical protein